MEFCLLSPIGQQEKELMGEIDDEFPIFQKEWNGTVDFCATAVKWVGVFFAYWARTEQKK